MKKKLIKIFNLILCVFAFCSCFNYQTKDINDMNFIELNQYNKYLQDENAILKDLKEELKEISDGKTYNDIVGIINYVNDEIVKSNVMITSQAKSLFQSTSISSGSGTIIKEDDLYYYVLTNNHVIYSFGYNVYYYVYDYLNNEYSNAQVLFSDPNYDMALVRFKKGNDKLKVTKLASADIRIKENVIIIGQPQGQRNTVTLGEVISYGKVECSDCQKDESNVKYDCVYYNAITTNGNSGGMILDYDYNLVGIVTFGMNASNGEYLYGAGSPVSKIKEFFSGNNFEVGDNND